MPKQVRNVLIAVAVSFTVAVLDRVLLRGSPMAASIVGLGLGALVYALLMAEANLPPENLVRASDRAQMLSATPPPGAALVFVSRTGLVGRVAIVEMLLDGVVFAEMRSPRFAAIPVTPGVHTVSARRSSKSPSSKQNIPATLQFSVAAGERLVFDVAIGASVTRFQISLTPLADSRSALAKLASIQMVQSTPVGVQTQAL